MAQTASKPDPAIRQVTIAALLCALLSACASAPPPPDPEPVVIVEPEPEIPIVVADPEPQPEPVAAPEPPKVTIVLSSRSAAYEDVAEELGNLFETVSIYDLTDRSQPPERAFRLINDSDTDAVVAIGLRAARSSVALAAVPVVFSQVFNHQDHALVGERSRGVAAIAPVDVQLAAWKEAQPTLVNVGLVIGPGHDELIAGAEIAALERGISLSVHIANSDQEALYYFKRMVRDIDGFWLLPDNRVLSARVLREIVDQSNRRGVTVLVPNPSMLQMGAAISVSTVASDIAARISEVIAMIHSGELGIVPAITPLSETLIETNEAVLGQHATASTEAQQ
ncbi:MAG: ABC transporter substrate binding protein [Woeseiaceae bacterium]|nr:ABC transporter substrate binding protein [Woeseiaceae bacterium]